MQEQASAASLEIFTLGLEQSQWRARAFQHSFIPSATDAFLHMDRSALDIYMTTCAVESVERLEWLEICHYPQGWNIRVSGTDIAFDDDISTMPACKYAALFDNRKCFDGLRFSFLSRICEPRWQNIDQCWPHDLDEAQTEQLVFFTHDTLCRCKDVESRGNNLQTFLVWRGKLFVMLLQPGKHFSQLRRVVVVMCTAKEKHHYLW